ncbi:FliH/SctL family protein [Kineococcus radiotolerans]|uniref:Flagellar biosynthesis/type III secretory pathway protein-like n=1 Tax=Kineococcus radiotolerans (strain ATCC BAA-149 / DSM 14245 / SRS30216) TaxID=266940 RepID=A6W8J9_KINRD|nr:FliH/SctL family protein [Kineococcus radiotolerans]ABS03138.1 flagellar biosynthesis/type III secretory pathway protein-like [Kineococcus radiotolerans SRS30216 = ATCC BAA-149]
MTSWRDASRPATSSRAFTPADTRPGTREPRVFVAVPAATSTSPRGFVGLDLTGRDDSEALQRVRESARTEGYAAGWAAGMRQAAEKAAAELERQREAAETAARLDREERRAARNRAEEALFTAGEALRAEREPGIGALADTVLELALELAGAVLDREVTLAGSPVHDAVQRALRPLDGEKPVTVRVNPADLSALTGDALKGRHASSDADLVTYLPDPTVQPGDAVARQGDTEVDAGLRASVSRALEALVGTEGSSGDPA